MGVSIILQGGHKMAKLTDFKTPTGATGNLLNPLDWLGLIMGVVVLLATFGIGQNIANKLNGKGPFDTELEPVFKNPIPPMSNDSGIKVI
jgi:hypothetical protein